MNASEQSFVTLVGDQLLARSVKGAAVLSLDVFDTLLYRRVRSPVDVFLASGHLLSESGSIDLSPHSFAQRRESAERAARDNKRSRSGNHEVTLKDIYRALPRLGVDATDEELIQAEIACEQSLLLLDTELSMLCARAIQLGVRIVLVSDTYYSAEEIRTLLTSTGFDCSMLHSIFTSSDYELCKGTGLFGKVLTELAIAPEQMLHIGDHPWADIEVPDKMQIGNVHYKKFEQHQPEIATKEQKLHDHAVPAPFRSCTHSGIDGLRARFLTAQQYSGSEAQSAAWLLGATTYGPVLSGFIDWLHQRADKVKATVCFVTREGIYLNELFNIYNQARGTALAGVHLPTSRNLLYQATIIEGSCEELNWIIFHRRTPLTPEGFAKTFDLDFDDLGVRRGLRHYPLRNTEIARDFISAVMSNDRVMQQLKQYSLRMRQYLLAYIEKQLNSAGKSLSDAEGIILSDLGWSGLSHHLLSRIIRSEYPAAPVRGLYLAVESAALSVMERGEELQGFLMDVGNAGGFGHLALRCKEIPEQITMPENIGSTVTFDDSGAPVMTSALELPVATHHNLAVIRRGIRAFFDYYLKQRDNNQGCVRLDDREAREALQIIYARPLILPTEAELSVLSTFMHDEGCTATQQSSEVVSSLDMAVAEYAPLGRLPGMGLYWPMATLLARRPQLVCAYLNMHADIPYRSQIHTEYDSGVRRYDSCVKLVRRTASGLEELQERVDVIVERDYFGMADFGFFASSPSVVSWSAPGCGDKFNIEKLLVKLRDTKKDVTAVYELPVSCDKKLEHELPGIGVVILDGERGLHIDLKEASEARPFDVNAFICVRQNEAENERA